MSKHINKKFRHLLELSDDERIQKIRETQWIRYTRANEILNSLEDLLAYPQTHRMPNQLIIGSTNNGKTTIVRRFLSLNPVKENEHGDHMSIPALYIEMPPEATQDTIYITILRQLQMPFQLRAKKEEKAHQVIQIMKRLKVQMLMIDELNNLLDNTKLRQAQVLNTIKYLGNQLQIPIVGIGTKEAHRAIQSDPQLANRFHPHELPQWKLNEEFLKLLVSFEQTTPLKKASNLIEKDIAIQLYSMSEGWIGELAQIIKLASIEAIKKKDECISLKLLENLKWRTPNERRKLNIS